MGVSLYVYRLPPHGALPSAVHPVERVTDGLVHGVRTVEVDGAVGGGLPMVAPASLLPAV